MTLSQAAIDLIVREEVTNRATYTKLYKNFEWPEGSSGPTVGIGYDCGYVTESECRADWAGIVDTKTINALVSAIGLTGGKAEAWVRANKRSVTISYDDAMRQFTERELPKWIGRCVAALPNFDKLSPDCAGALVSLTYNRGPSFSKAGDRYKEMRAIKAAMRDERYADIPAQFRSMARLWIGGVHQRRMNEAALFEQGLASIDVAPAVEPEVVAAEPLPANDSLPGPMADAVTQPAAPAKSEGRIRAESAMELAATSRKWLYMRVLKIKALALTGLGVLGVSTDDPKVADVDTLTSGIHKVHSLASTEGFVGLICIAVILYLVASRTQSRSIDDHVSGNYTPSGARSS